MPDEFGKFQKGEVNNPIGRNAHDKVKWEAKKMMKKLTTALVDEVVKDVLLVEPDKLGEEAARDASVLKAWIAKAAEKGANTGDLSQLFQLLDRTVGPVKHKVEISKNETRTVEELKAELALIEAKLANGNGT